MDVPEETSSDYITFIRKGAYMGYTIIYILGGAIPYIPQYMEMTRLDTVKGFSTYTCLTLLIANLLRICFWFVEHFSTPLLIQSLVMIVTMLVMMDRAARILLHEIQSHSPNLSSKGPPSSLRRTIWTGPVRFFWDWTDLSSYVAFTMLFFVVSLAVTNLFSWSQLFVQTLGFASLFTEAMLGLPQALRNYQNKSTEGMSLLMVLMWTVGDVSKSIFFILEGAPLQFPLCGWLQVGLDLVIFAQHFYYTRLRGRRLVTVTSLSD
ncbi:unnamed protein product [Calicophoron daubneyi]|uniref:PQ-loop repeat-containing protein 1 n=1 Tax=Calicophoron daubneyi TaxID=300641 RepID=A0AAV2TM66_CALDB